MNSKLFLSILIAVACLSQFASDVYAPSLPAIAIGLSAPIYLAQFSLVVYMFGVAGSLLIYGTLSEGFGRKIPLIIGLAIMSSGGIICMLAANIDVLIFGRLIQGIGAGACAGLWRAIFRDAYSGEQLSRIGGYLGLIVAFIIPGAPTIGGYIQQYFGWRTTFLFISIYTLLILLTVIFIFKDTSKHHHKERLRWRFIFATFSELLKSRIFMGITVCIFLTFGAFFSWFAVGPILLIHHLGISPVMFGWISFIGIGIVYIIGSWLNGKLVRRIGMPNVMRLGWCIMIIAGLLLLVGDYIWGIKLWNIFIPVIVFYFGSTLIWPSAFATAITPFGKIAGYAGSLYSFMQMAGGAVIGTIAAHLPNVNQIPIALMFIIVPLMALLVYELIVGRQPQDV